MNDLENNLEEVLERIDWASNTHKDKFMFGLDELGASIAREHRLHGVLMESRKFIIAQGRELQKTREQLEIAEKVIEFYCESAETSRFELFCGDKVSNYMARQYFKEKDKQGE